MSEPALVPETEVALRRRPPSRRLTLLIAVLGGVGSGWLSHGSGASVVGSIASGIFMAVFMYPGLRFMTMVRFRYNPPDVDPDQRDTASPPPPGGWASPTSGQRAVRRVSRMLDRPNRKHRPPR